MNIEEHSQWTVINYRIYHSILRAQPGAQAACGKLLGVLSDRRLQRVVQARIPFRYPPADLKDDVWMAAQN